MWKNLFLVVAAGLSSAAFFSCHPLEPYQTEQFSLTAGPAAAEGYPMEIVEGRFLTSDGKQIPFAPEFLEGEWGLAHSTAVSGDGRAAAPDSLEVRWFSYPEDKFYEGQFLLPQRRIYDLLKQGYWDKRRNRQDTYDALTMCLLPKGVVVVWLSGQNQVLIGRYVGREVAFDFKRFNSAANRPLMIQQEQAKLPALVQAQIRTGTLRTQQWDNYLTTYPWKIEFSQPLTLNYYGADYFNGESGFRAPTQDMVSYAHRMLKFAPRPVPRSIFLRVGAGYGRERQIQVRAFDEAETLAAFQTLHAANPTLPLTLYVETDARVSKARLFLQNERQRVALDKTKIELYDGE